MTAPTLLWRYGMGATPWSPVLPASVEIPARRRAEAAWEEFWAATRVLELTADVAAHAGQLVGEQALRAADAVHLASALAMGTPDLLLAVWEQRLGSAADEAGVQVVPSRPSRR